MTHLTGGQTCRRRFRSGRLVRRTAARSAHRFSYVDVIVRSGQGVGDMPDHVLFMQSPWRRLEVAKV
ncbi:MAG: hypothetical protein NVV83_12490 [Afipia sp.]|nr:hypothetical protein [Afipia sp.]